MKKLFAALMALCLMLSAAAFAQETLTVKWDDYEAKAAAMEGRFAEVGNTGLKMFIPAQFKDTRLSEETLAGGTFMVLKQEGGDGIVTAQVVKLDIDSFKASLNKQGMTLYASTVNGIPFIQFNAETNGTTNTVLALSMDQNTTLVFSFAPFNRNPYTDLFKVMAASLQKAE